MFNRKKNISMNIQYFKEYSPALGREMEWKVYGHGGRPVLYIPCQDGRFFDFEDFVVNNTAVKLDLRFSGAAQESGAAALTF